MQFRITAPHHISDRIVPEGTIVGDGTEFPVSGPSMFMEALDDEAQKAIDARMAKWGGRAPPAEIMLQPTSTPVGQRVPGTGAPATKPVAPSLLTGLSLKND